MAFILIPICNIIVSAACHSDGPRGVMIEFTQSTVQTSVLRKSQSSRSLCSNFMEVGMLMFL